MTRSIVSDSRHAYAKKTPQCSFCFCLQSSNNRYSLIQRICDHVLGKAVDLSIPILYQCLLMQNATVVAQALEKVDQCSCYNIHSQKKMALSYRGISFSTGIWSIGQTYSVH